MNDANIMAEMSRIGHRQFHWQTGYFHKSNFYRSSFLYGQARCADYFIDRWGISPNDLSMVGFALFAASEAHVSLRLQTYDLRPLGLTPATIERGVGLLAAPRVELQSAAATAYRRNRPLAYQASVLREHPVVRLPEGVVVPIRDLLLRRITAGLYYDLVDAGGEVRREIGERFELYARDLMAEYLQGFEVRPEYAYGPRGHETKTPDLVLGRRGRCEIVVECKTTKMPLAAMYSLNPTGEAKRQLGELSKGVFQIWRYCAHARLGRVREALAENPVGLLLTADDWALMADLNYRAIVDGAVHLADEEGGIQACDRIPVAIAGIKDLEITLAEGTDDGLTPTLHRAASDNYFGWALPSIQADLGLKAVERKTYPFGDRLREVLPGGGRWKPCGPEVPRTSFAVISGAHQSPAIGGET